MSSGGYDILFLIITHMEEDGCTFWAQRHSPTINMDLEHVTSRLERVSKVATKPTNPIEGGVYGTKFVDESWYRCRVLFPISKAKCLVQYIDFGNCEEKAKSALVNIPIDLQESSLPPMAHRYRLYNLHIDPDNVAEARKHIETRCSDDFVKAKLVSMEKTSPMEVVLYDEEGSSIGHQLIELGLAADAASGRVKKTIRMSSPMISPAQHFKNPFLSSSDEGNTSDDINNNLQSPQKGQSQKKPTSSDSSGIDSMKELACTGGPDGFVQAKKKLVMECENCEVNKEATERMRLSMIKLRLDLKESENKISSLAEQEEYWKKKYMELKEEKIRAESTVVSTNNVPKIDQVELKRENLSPMKETEVVKVSSQDSPAKTVSPRKDLDVMKEMSENFAKASAIMKKVILPTFEFTKKLSSSNKVVGNFVKYRQDLKDIVTDIKKFLDNGGNKNADQLCALISRRNAVLQDLKQTIHSTLPLVTTAGDAALREKVQNYISVLGKILPESCSTIKEDAGATITISDVCDAIQKWKTDRENNADLSEIKHRLLACLYQQSEKYYLTKGLVDQVKETQDEILNFQSQEKTMKEALDEIKSIRRKRQKIRLLVAELKNLEEEEKDADDSERESLKEQKEKIAGELSEQRKDLQDCFEKKWILLESLANMVEKFSPELQTEHPELGIEDYLKGKAVFIKDMELDHFDIEYVQMDENAEVEILHTEYRAESICLHKYPPQVISDKSWGNMLEYVAMYSNIDSPNAAIPLGIFKHNDTVCIMVSTPQHETFSIDEVVKCDKTLIPKILKDVASALKALHVNGITYGQLSRNAITVAVKPCIQAYLLVPNFLKVSAGVPLAEDIRNFGLLIKSLIENTSNPKLQVVAEHCLKNSVGLSMQSILEAL